MKLFAGLFLTLAFIATTTYALGRVGGLHAHPADERAQAIADKIRDDVQSKLGYTAEEFTVTEYATQTVAGTNFFLKIRLGGDKYLHARVFQSLPPALEVSLKSLELDKTAEDPLTYF